MEGVDVLYVAEYDALLALQTVGENLGREPRPTFLQMQTYMYMNMTLQVKQRHGDENIKHIILCVREL